MSYEIPNASAATLTKNRTGDDICPTSGLCVTCVDGCVGMCEVGRSAYRGPEMIYPQPFGTMTTAGKKDYPVDLSHFTILGTAVGAHGIEADSDVALFPNVKLETKLGGIPVRLPFVVPGLGSTNVALMNWEGLAIGCALSGFPLTIGENVCGMDPASKIVKGRILKSPELARRVALYKEWMQDGYGDIILQANVEDTRLGVQEYGIAELGIETVELKWGQGAKSIGGEVKIKDLAKATMLRERGYIVLPDPLRPEVQEAYKKGIVREFERHSRVGMVSEESFLRRVEELKRHGAKRVFLKTGAYRPADLARAIRFSSDAGVAMLTVDAAGGGTGMSPWRMMNEWGLPPVEIYSLTRNYAERLKRSGARVPDLVFAGGFTLEDQIFKGLALGAPYVKGIGMARAPLAAAMVGKTIGNLISEGRLPVYLERYGNNVEEIFVSAEDLRLELGDRFSKVPAGALGLYTYMLRLRQGLQQLMCGARKFTLDTIGREDLAALSREASQISGIPHVMDVDREEVDKILGSE